MIKICIVFFVVPNLTIRIIVLSDSPRDCDSLQLVWVYWVGVCVWWGVVKKLETSMVALFFIWSLSSPSSPHQYFFFYGLNAVRRYGYILLYIDWGCSAWTLRSPYNLHLPGWEYRDTDSDTFCARGSAAGWTVKKIDCQISLPVFIITRMTL